MNKTLDYGISLENADCLELKLINESINKNL